MAKGINVLRPGLAEPQPRRCLVCDLMRTMEANTLPVCRECRSKIAEEDRTIPLDDLTASVERLVDGDVMIVRCRNNAAVGRVIDSIKIDYLTNVLVIDNSLDVTVEHGVMRIEGCDRKESA